MLLEGTVLTYLPGLLVVTVEAVVGGNHGRQPAAIFTTVLVLFLLNSVLNPISLISGEMYMTFLFIATKC